MVPYFIFNIYWEVDFMNPFNAIYCNNTKELKNYIDKNDINVRNEKMMSLLEYAIVFNNSEAIDLLLENYIDINIKDKYGDTALHYCVTYNRMGYLKTLINHKASLSIKNEEGETPLYKACALGRENMIRLFLESCNLNLYDTNSRNETIFMAMIKSRNKHILESIDLDNRIIDEKDFVGNSALHIAARRGDIEIVRYLLSKGAFVNAKNNNRETPLFYASENDHKDVIDALIKAGALVDCISALHDTIYHRIHDDDLEGYINMKAAYYGMDQYYIEYPLHYAIITEDYERVVSYSKMLNTNRKDKFGYMPEDLALKIGNKRIIEYLDKNLR